VYDHPGERGVTERKTLSIMLELFSEIFFATVPLIIFIFVWHDKPHLHSESVFTSPEISVPSCVLYGLALARFVKNSMLDAIKGAQKRTASAEEISTRYAFVVLIPIVGLIVSTVLIIKSFNLEMSNWLNFLQLFNLVASMVVFFFLAGSGLETGETKRKPK
jgi:uncharacterized protein (DUF983 family)